MAQKITSKNLSYDDSLPPFLARLRNQHAASSVEPDPILASRRRAAKPRSASEEAEDGPLVVDEEGVTVSGVTVGKDGEVVTAEKEEGGSEGGEREMEVEVEKRKEEKVAAIGGGRKRKVGKVVGANEEEEEEEEGSAKAASKKVEANKAKKDYKNKELPKGKKKAKKIKLSFGDEDGD
ncbi:hypothetical protein N0V82_008539 [Gnomoniopsis sp. IMI 355080]|nr:hypothetical protein N0V82_008539 [Gnomoniopsis sp. IMI 355080]